MRLEATVKSLSVACCLALILAVLPGVYRGELFAWHPLFMGVGLLGFMTEGLLAATNFRPLEGGARVQAIQNHALIQAGSLLSVGVGFYAIWRNKELNGKPHLVSLHAKVGLVTVLMVAAAPLLGALSFRRLGLLQRLPEQLQPHIKWLHRLLGACTWCLALVAMQLDLPHPAVLEGLLCRIWQAGVAAMGLAMLAVLRSRLPSGRSSLPTVASGIFRASLPSVASGSFRSVMPSVPTGGFGGGGPKHQ